jgi:glycosyltransferase involved in cell wall biosynthesis
MFPAQLAIVIPAYQPAVVLAELMRTLRPADWQIVVVVDDGSDSEYRFIFETVAGMPGVKVLRHAVNLGKGAALKTGIGFALARFPYLSGIVTVDADGQHHPDDVQSVTAVFCRDPNSLVLGVRDFSGAIPLRSKLGNRITRQVLRAAVGQTVADSQTGLRAVPSAMLPTLLRVAATGYEFELQMLIAAKQMGVSVVEQTIQTIYQPGNPTSHFRPLRDSMRIYYLLLRFAGIGLISAVLDNLVFCSLYLSGRNVFLAQAGARLASILFNYPAVRWAVFCSEDRHRVLLPRYLLVALANVTLSYLGVRLLTGTSLLGVIRAKLLVEAILFIFGFLAQRDWVFVRHGA